MANVDVRVKDGVKQHRHPGYPKHGSPEWHPVSQHHDDNLHEKYGITGNEKPNRATPEQMTGVRRPGKEDLAGKKPAKKPTQEEETQGKNALASAVSEVTDKWKNKFKALSRQAPRNPWAKLLYDATMPILGFAQLVQSKMKEEDAKATLRGFDKAMDKFDEITALSDEKSIEQMSLKNIKRLDADLMREIKAKYEEYGGAELKGKHDRESLEKKAEIKAYLDIVNNLREQARIKAEQLQSGKPSETRTAPGNRTRTSGQGSGKGTTTTASLRERRQQQIR